MAFGTDYTPVGPMPTDIVLGDVDATSMRLARDIRDKGHGIDTRETMARMMLKSSTMHNHLIKVNNALKVQNDEYYRQFTDVLKELSKDKDYYSLPEITVARRGYNTLTDSLNNLSADMLNPNLGKLTQLHISDELLAQIAGDAAVNAVPADGSLTTEKYAQKSITPDKINGTAEKINVLNPAEMMVGKFYTHTGVQIGEPVILASSSVWYGTATPIPVKKGDVIRMNKAFMNGYYIPVDSSNNKQAENANPSISPSGLVEIIVDGDNVTGFHTAVHRDDINTAMVTINRPMPSAYVSPNVTEKKELEWLNLQGKSVDLKHLSDAVTNKLNSANNHQYIGSDGVVAGDSIVANTGSNPTGSEVLIGYDGVLIRELELNSLENIGVSGRPMASGTSAGIGTSGTVVGSNLGIDWTAKKFLLINAGTNDFKLNVPIGEIQPFNSTFDASTYLGAYQKMIEHVKTNNADIEIIIMTPAQRSNSGYTTESTNTTGHKLIDYVNAAKAVSQKYSCTLVDVYSESGITEFTINQDTYDGLHLNNNGYEKAGMLAVQKMIYG